MIITEEAKLLIKDALDANDFDCLRITMQEGCCGTSLNIKLAKQEEGEEPITINDISVIMDKLAQKRAETVTLSVEDGDVVIVDDAACCC